MATNIVSGLFGIDPAILGQQQQNRMTSQALQYASLSPGEQSQYSAFLGGGMAGRAVQGMMGIEDPQMKKAAMAQQLASQFDITTPEGLTSYAQALAQNGAPDLAQMAVKRAEEMTTTASTQFKNLAQAQKATRETIPAAEEEARRIRLDQLKKQYGEIEGARKFNDEQLAARTSVAKAGAAVPESGQVPLTVIKQAQDIVSEYTKDPKTKLNTVAQIAILGESVKSNPTSLPQFQRELVKLAGDSQIGQNEVRNILGSSGFGADLVDGINKFFTGAPTNVKIDDVLRGVQALEKHYAKQYETGRQKSKTVLSEGKINQQTQEAILPPAYVAPKAPPKVGEIRGGYRFKGGNPADKNNYVKVQ
jgi:ribosome assembly protein YihI (activator of Der GTPase)